MIPDIHPTARIAETATLFRTPLTMPARTLEIGIVTDEISRDLGEALSVGQSWGLNRFELREGAERRFPAFTQKEVGLVDDAVRAGVQITAVSPGIFKSSVEDAAQRDRDMSEVLPRAIEKAVRFECPVVIAFGFAKREGEPGSNRLQVQKTFERAAEQAAEAGLILAIENEPDFWIDRSEPSASLLAEIGHPSLKINWDPANLHWGGKKPERADLEALLPFVANVHVKDFTPDDPKVPWRAIGEGTTPWEEILGWLVEDTSLAHITLETHVEPLVENARKSLDTVREMLVQQGTEAG